MTERHRGYWSSVQAQQTVVRAVVRPYGSPLPLGFFSFAVGMLLLAGLALHWITGTDERVAGILMAAFVFPLEIMATTIAFLARDTATAATLGLFSTSWLALGLVGIFGASGSTSPAEGLYLVGFSVVLAMLAIAAMPTKPLIGLLLVVTVVRTALSAAYQLGAPQGLDTAAGIDALVIFVVAVYLGLAFLMEDTKGREVLPVWRRGAAAQAFDGDIGDQLGRLPDEAGIRQQL